MLIEVQKRNESYKEIIGEDLEGFCREIIDNSYKLNIFEILLRTIYLSILTIIIPILIVGILVSLLIKENLIFMAFEK